MNIIAILGHDKGRRDDVEAQIRACPGLSPNVKITQYATSREHVRLARPAAPCAVFAVIDGENALIDASKASAWGEGYPVVMVATHPQYAMEGIRQKVRHYILFPLEREEIAEALKRTEVIP